MELREALRACRQWIPFASATAAYGTMSLVLGPFTNGRASLEAMQRWCKTSTRMLKIRVDGRGVENVPAEGAFVYCSNHQSIVDIIVLGSVLPHDYKWAAKRSLMKIPFLGWHLQLAGHVPVDRGRGPAVARAVMERFVSVLRAGKPLLVFPEGTRSASGALQAFKVGSFYAAVRAGVPVVPVIVSGTFELMKKGAFDTGEGDDRPVKVVVGAPIPIVRKDSERATVESLRDRTRAAMADMVRALGGAVEAVEAAADEKALDDFTYAMRDDGYATAAE
ncbi:MAG: lysophospholipid acyltransferase family protein [Polyangiaceae bacterium]